MTFSGSLSSFAINSLWNNFKMLLSKLALRTSVSVRRFSALTQRVSPPMSTERARQPHEERTAGEPRDPNVYSVILSDIEQVNSNVRLYKLSVKDQDQGIRVCQVSSNDFKVTTSGIGKVPPWPMARRVRSWHSKGGWVHDYLQSICQQVG